MEKKKTISRREFFKDAGLIAGGIGATALIGTVTPVSATAATTASTTMSDAVRPIAPVSPPAKWDYETDVIVVGTGCSGGAATLGALEKGVKVITLDKNGIWGGHCQFSMVYAPSSIVGEGESYTYGGPAAGWVKNSTTYTSFARATSAFDHQIEVQDCRARDSRIDSLIANQAVTNFAWLQSLGVTFTRQYTWIGKGSCYAPIDPDYTEPATLSNTEAIVKGIAASSKYLEYDTTGKGLQWWPLHPYNTVAISKALKAKAETYEGSTWTMMYSTPVVSLVKSGSSVVGVKAQQADGTIIYIKAASVVLCTGGYTANREMIEYYWDARRVMEINRYMGLPSATGDGIRMAQGLDAETRYMDEQGEIWDGGVTDPTMLNGPRSFYSGANQMSRQATLTVNKQGKRFFQENRVIGSLFFYRAKMKNVQQDSTVFTIYGRNMLFDSNGKPTTAYIIQNYSPVACEWPTPWFEADITRQIASGVIMKADTVADMASQMGVNVATLTKTINDYNAYCTSGQDIEMFKPAKYMKTITAPFYFTKSVGGSLMNTYGGLRINDDMNVVTGDYTPISGLYAAGETVAMLAQVDVGIGSGRLAGQAAAAAAAK